MAECKRCILGHENRCWPHAAEDANCSLFRPITNADRIRAMSDEELAEFHAPATAGCPPSWRDAHNKAKNCKDCWLEWLRKEVE